MFRQRFNGQEKRQQTSSIPTSRPRSSHFILGTYATPLDLYIIPVNPNIASSVPMLPYTAKSLKCNSFFCLALVYFYTGRGQLLGRKGTFPCFSFYIF